MVKCVLVIMSLSGQVTEQVATFNSCESASIYAIQTGHTVLMISSYKDEESNGIRSAEVCDCIS